MDAPACARFHSHPTIHDFIRSSPCLRGASTAGSLGRPSLLADGVHPNEDGAVIIFELLRDAIASHFPELRPAGVPGGMLFDFPDHVRVDVALPGMGMHARQSDR